MQSIFNLYLSTAMPVQFIFLWKSILKKKYAEYKCFSMAQPFIDPYESMDPLPGVHVPPTISGPLRPSAHRVHTT